MFAVLACLSCTVYAAGIPETLFGRVVGTWPSLASFFFLKDEKPRFARGIPQLLNFVPPQVAAHKSRAGPIGTYPGPMLVPRD